MQSSRKKLENRRLAFDASMTKLQKARRDDYRVEEEVRTAKAKYEESSEDVLRRMQDIKDAELDSVRDLGSFLDAELEYHERCAEELRRVRANWVGPAPVSHGYSARPTGRSRSNTAHSYNERLSRTSSHNIHEVDEQEPVALPVRMPIRSNSIRAPAGLSARDAPEVAPRPPLNRSHTLQPPSSRQNGGFAQNASSVGSLRGQLRPISRISTTRDRDDIFGDRDDDTASGSGSPEWGERSASPATSYGSLSRSTSNLMINNAPPVASGTRKAPPPPPPSRSKKPPPPVPAKREVGY